MTAITLARPDDLDRLLPLVAAFHAEQGVDMDDGGRRAAMQPLLEGSPHGALYIVGPNRAPIGYVMISFGWSLRFGGLDGVLDEIFIRPGVRGRRIGTEILLALPKTLGAAGLRALHLEVERDKDRARALFERLSFRASERSMRMTRVF